MASHCHLFLLLQMVSVVFGKYFYVAERKSWYDAQDHCSQNYTDLAPISNEYDSTLLFKQNSGSHNVKFIWIGLMRSASNNDQWLWSGAGEVVRTFWRQGEPNNDKGKEDRGVILQDLTWNDVEGTWPFTFFCYKVNAIRERKSWEEALVHCRTHHQDLASVASETELKLMQKELGALTAEITEHVWIGLRFLAEEWLWVDGQPLEYEAWAPGGLGGEPQCPLLKRCAALQVTGTSRLISGMRVVDTVTDVREWMAKSCEEKLHFLCY